MKMNKISREAKLMTELRSNFWPRGCTGKGKMKCTRAGNLVSKAQWVPWVSEGVSHVQCHNGTMREKNVKAECGSQPASQIFKKQQEKAQSTSPLD